MAASSKPVSVTSNFGPLLPHLKALPPALGGLTFPELFFNPLGQPKRELSSVEQLTLEGLPDLRNTYLNDSRSPAPRRLFALVREKDLFFFSVAPGQLFSLGSCSKALIGNWPLFVSCDRPLLDRLFTAPISEEIGKLVSSDELLIAESSPTEALSFWTNNGKEPLFLASMIELFPNLKSELDFTIQDDSDRTALHRAVLADNVEEAVALIRRGGEKESRALDNKTPLQLATIHGNCSMVEALLKLGCDPLVLTNDGESLLQIALFTHGEDNTSLHQAAHRSAKSKLVDLLIQAGVGVNTLSRHGTSLHYAANHGHLESVLPLLRAGARIDLLNENQESPVDLALRSGHPQIAWLLLTEEEEGISDLTFPSHSGTSSSSQASSSDLAGSSYSSLGLAYAAFEEAYERKKESHQLFWLEELSQLYIEGREYLRASHCLNGALSLVMNSGSHFDERREALISLIFSQLERVEDLALQAVFQKRIPTHRRGYLKGHREELRRIRNETADLMKEGWPIEKVLERATISYQILLKILINESIDFIDQGAPSEFAVIGLGSMARMEMCPYSDTEFAFLIGDPSDERLDYFRKLSEFLALKMVNMGETKFPLIRFKRGKRGAEDRPEKSLVPTGFSLDIGGLCPSGKEGVYELIGTPDDLASFQTSGWLATNSSEIILVNALTLSSCVMGDTGLALSYENEVNRILNAKTRGVLSWIPKKLRENRALELMSGFVDDFIPKIDQEKIRLRAFDVKKELYRLPQTVVSGLALYYGLKGTNTIERIEELRRRKVFSTEGANQLKKVFRSILQMRVEAHLFYQTEREILYYPREEEFDTTMTLLSITPELSAKIVEIYRTLIPLHERLEAFLKGDQKAFSRSSLYDPTVGSYNESSRIGLRYDDAYRGAIGQVAFSPNSSSARRNLAMVEMDLGQARRAVKQYKEALILLRAKEGSDSYSEIASCLNNLGNAHFKLGKYQKAIDCYEESLTLLALIYNNAPNLDSAKNLMDQGLAHFSLDKTNEAIRFLNDSFIMFCTIYNNEPHPDLAENLNRLGVVYASSKNYDRAIEYHKRAFEIYQQVHRGRPHPDIASTYGALSLNYMQSGQYIRGLGNCRLSLDMFKKIHRNRPHPDLGESLMNLGSVYLSLGQHKRAIRYYQRSLEMFKRIHGSDPHPDIAHSLNNLALAHKALDQHKEAIACSEEALMIYQELFHNAPHTSIADGLYNLALAYHNSGRSAEAIVYYERAIATNREIYGDEPLPPHVADIFDHLGAAYNKQKEYEQAIICHQEALKMKRAIYGPEPHVEIALTLADLGYNYHQLENYPKGTKKLKAAYEIFRRTVGTRHPDAQRVKNLLDLAEMRAQLLS